MPTPSVSANEELKWSWEKKVGVSAVLWLPPPSSARTEESMHEATPPALNVGRPFCVARLGLFLIIAEQQQGVRNLTQAREHRRVPEHFESRRHPAHPAMVLLFARVIHDATRYTITRHRRRGEKAAENKT